MFFSCKYHTKKSNGDSRDYTPNAFSLNILKFQYFVSSKNRISISPYLTSIHLTSLYWAPTMCQAMPSVFRAHQWAEQRFRARTSVNASEALILGKKYKRAPKNSVIKMNNSVKYFKVKMNAKKIHSEQNYQQFFNKFRIGITDFSFWLKLQYDLAWHC